MIKYLLIAGATIVTIVVLVLTLSTLFYRKEYQSVTLKYQAQSGQIEARNKEAADKLRILTAERDQLQKQLNDQAKAQNEADQKAASQIAADTRAAAAAPVVVRYVRQAGGCGRGPAGRAATSAQPGAADASSTSGVLAPEAARRFNSAVNDIETLQLAYNSCRTRLVPEGK